MRQLFKTAALAALLLAAIPAAQAASQTYSFSGMLESGALVNESYSGQFSFDDAGLNLIGEQYLAVDSFSMNFLNSNWGLAQLSAGAVAEVKFADGSFAGLSYSGSQGGVGFSAVAGFSDTSDAYVAYTPLTGNEGTGSMILTAVPEPESLAMLLAGVVFLGGVARRRNRA